MKSSVRDRSEKDDAEKLESIPNVGPAIAAKLRTLGIASRSELAGQDAYELYDNLNEQTGKRHDPCLLDVFISAVSFADGEPSRPWWEFTAQRKIALSQSPVAKS